MKDEKIVYRIVRTGKAYRFGRRRKMKTAEVYFEISEDILDVLNQNIMEFTQQSRLFTALQLYKNHKLSFGKAAELAGISKDEFLIALDKNEIDFIDYDPADLEAELERF